MKKINKSKSLKVDGFGSAATNTHSSGAIRLFVAASKIAENDLLKIVEGDFEYLAKVMRRKIGDTISIFNGIDGEFLAKITTIEKKSLSLQICKRTKSLKKAPNITLAFALIKNVRVDFLAAKACELGVTRFAPIISDHCVVDKLNFDRFKANVKEACEQCERNDFPEILPLEKFSNFLINYEGKNSAEKIFIFGDESGGGKTASSLFPELISQYDALKPSICNASQDKVEIFPPILPREIIVIIGPEGGFSKKEFQKMRVMQNCFAMSLGPRIMRADTAAIAALTLVQEFLGDFS